MYTMQNIKKMYTLVYTLIKKECIKKNAHTSMYTKEMDI